ncbi:hypothetical protein HG536_0A04820 [Torulaspora globosa]|uniref:DUF559 domain-containing protein n=1 Tax=Torulaspora globosa TaxID=48254 RepID=A0A7G3ZAY0_9SACH|nr:uncharacterized protein HG536_0A04820 [Torulaspora globosa]QLL30666.1 hypothetical protein HG536_0A04820 [Torulaspora globosa]
MTKKKSLEEFVEECRKVHDDKYNYSITNYTRWDCKIEYTCPIHGVQSQRADNHRRGMGCKLCGRERIRKTFALTTEKFIETCKKKHNNRYSYPDTVYVNYESAVKIECARHGEFVQKAGCHLIGSGCQKCAVFNKSSGPALKPADYDEFVGLSITVHGDVYDYSQVKYKNHYVTVDIVCRDHGPFRCTPTVHLKGKGCATCQNFDAFVQKAKSIHGDKFQYDKSTYIRSKTKMRILCREHGEFWQIPADHARVTRKGGFYCPSCSLENKRLTIDEVKERSRNIHGLAYKFDKLVLGKSLEEEAIFYCIKCAKYFSQKPVNHLKGSGCSWCCESKHEKKIRNWLQTMDYQFESQKRFPDLRYEKSLRCDFYLEQFNLIIEFDGIQHFEPVEAWGGFEEFLRVQARDRAKDDYCTEKRINLLRMKDGQDVIQGVQDLIELIKANETGHVLHMIYGKLATF